MPALKPATIGQKFLTDCGQNRPLTTIIAEYNGESAIIIGGVILVISVISSILVIYKWGESKANLKESINSMDNNIAISEEKLKQYKKELYGE